MFGKLIFKTVEREILINNKFYFLHNFNFNLNFEKFLIDLVMMWNFFLILAVFKFYFMIFFALLQ